MPHRMRHTNGAAKYTPTSHPHIFIPLRPRFVVKDIAFNEAHMCVLLENSNMVCAFHAKTGKLMTNLQGHTQPVTCLDLIENVCVTGSKDTNVNIYFAECTHDDVDQLASSLPVPLPNIKPRVVTGHTGEITCVKMIDNGSVVSGSTDTSVRLGKENNKGVFVSTPLENGHSETITVLRADSKFVVSGSSDKTVRVWDTRSEKQKFVLTGHLKGIKDIALDSKNMRLITGDLNDIVKIWDLRDGSLQHTLTGQTSFKLDAMGNDLACVGSNGCMFIWDCGSAELLKIISHEELLQSGGQVLSTSDQSTVTSSDSGISIWCRDTGDLVGKVAAGATELWVGKTFGKTIVSACQYEDSAGVEAHFLN
ncbi:putative WD repeat-containing protein [Yarrowia sp. C11]|nr:putative WD repeat-containing protein [Yarrowia sp. E02]KAG5372826.1 putative WD repeat-containing protein [Yarrowia sp. C11]